VASPNVVMFYNRGQVYRRRPLDAVGDASDWFAFAPGVLSEVLSELDPERALRPERPFRLTHAPSGAPEYLAQRRLVEQLVRGDSRDSLVTDEACMLLLRRVIGGTRRYPGRGRERRPATRRQRDELVAAACEVLALRFAERVTLNQVAREVGASPYHLARIFKQGTGSTMHRHLEGLRLRAALEALAETRDIATIGLSLGYSSHSHFTAAFHRAFGVTPSAYRSLGRSERTRIRARS
jgi:AraC-like DNA-binding protein